VFGDSITSSLSQTLEGETFTHVSLLSSARVATGVALLRGCIRRYSFHMAKISRQGAAWGLVLLALALLSIVASCGSSSPSSASTKGTYTTTSAGVAQPLDVSQVSNGPRAGTRIVGAPTLVWVWDQSGRVTFGLFLTNRGTLPFACKALRATQIPTKGVYRGETSPSGSCMRPGQMIAPGSRDFVTFFLPGRNHRPKDVVVMPFGSNTGRMVWTVAGCPTTPKACLGRFQKLG
jgi:hypothetical protein